MYSHTYATIMARSETAKKLKEYAAANSIKMVDLIDQMVAALTSTGPIQPPPHKNAFSPNPQPVDVLRTTEMPGVHARPLVDKAVSPKTDEFGTPIEQGVANTNKLVKKVKKETLCPHGVSLSGYCRKCAGD